MAAMTVAQTLPRAAFKTSAQPVIEVDEPNIEEEKEDAHEPAVEMEHEDTDQRHEEEKEDAHTPAVEMEHEDAN
ncbi:hypothetical protein Q3G72_015915 [Acer saccharum]|nr:hypothetical protein Q3G72_015915 [Acer saccharum]